MDAKVACRVFFLISAATLFIIGFLAIMTSSVLGLCQDSGWFWLFCSETDVARMVAGIGLVAFAIFLYVYIRKDLPK